MKRILLFVLTNMAILLMLMVVYHVVCALVGVPAQGAFSHADQDLTALALFALIFGMAGGVISLLLSKPIAKWSTHARVVDGTENEETRWLVETVRSLAERANIRMPEVAIYPGSANAFATGAFRNHALVAVSTDIMGQMTKEELRAVLGHEMSHVANGDMVTLTLIQGVLNAVVIFASRVLAFIASNAGRGEGKRSRGNGGMYFLVYYLMQFVLGLAASLVVMWFSRKREFAADKGSAELLGSPSPMIAALQRLGHLQPGVLPDSLKAFGAVGGEGTSLFATHPSLASRIEALQNLQRGIR